MSYVVDVAKTVAKKFIFPEGKVGTVMFGVLRGTKIPISSHMGWECLVGRWEPYLQKVYARIIKPGDTCYDLGANTGIHTVLFSQLAGPTGKIVAFEPLPANLAILRELIDLNGVRNVEIVEAAVSDTNATVTFFEGEHQKQGSLVGIGCETGTTIEVATRTIDSLVADGMAPPKFLKIDIEGAESRALTGAKKTLAEHRPAMVIELHTPEEDIHVGKILRELDYGAFRVFRNREDREHHSGRSLVVERLDLGWPHRNGLWGAVVAAPVERIEGLIL